MRLRLFTFTISLLAHTFRLIALDIFGQFRQRLIVDFRRPEWRHRPAPVPYDGTDVFRRKFSTEKARPYLTFMAITTNLGIDFCGISPPESFGRACFRSCACDIRHHRRD
jgi:hypothetical protein